MLWRLSAAAAIAAGLLAAPLARAARPVAAAPSDSTAVNKFLWYSPSTQTAYLQLNSALGGNNGGMNFNGNSSGSATITVPLGWKVQVHFTNLDAIPHSAIIINEQQPLPTMPQDPAFGGAYTRDLTGGLITGDSDGMNFKASKAGRYIIVCGVPGHGPSGMWIWFQVSADAKAPSYSM